MIFKHLVATFWSTRPKCGKSWSFLVITFVCRLWRETALGNSRLWTKVSLSGNPMLALRSIELSKDLPLEGIVVDGDQVELEVSLVRVIFQLLPRTQRLDISASRISLIPDSSTTSVQYQRLLGPHATDNAWGHLIEAPQLQSLVVQDEDDDFEHVRRILWVVQRAPALRFLAVKSYAGLWDELHKFPNLVDLEIRPVDEDPLYEGDAIPQAKAILGLSHLPNLVTLKIFCPVPDQDDSPTPTVHFPKLALLDLSGSPKAATRFLERITCPSSTYVRMDDLDVTTRREDASGALNSQRLLIPQLLRGAPEERLYMAEIACEGKSFVLTVWMESNLDVLMRPCSRPQPRLSLRLLEAPSAYLSFCRHLPLRELQILLVLNARSSHYNADPSLLQHLFGHASYMTTTGCDAGWLRTLLEPDQEGRVPFSGLEFWRTEGQVISPAWNGPTCPEHMLQYLLVRILASRRAILGHRLPKMVFAQDCVLPPLPSFRGVLKELVKRVEFLGEDTAVAS